MRTVIPKGARLVPQEATCVFKGQIFSVYQWQQKMYDGSYEIFEMLKRPDVVNIIGIKNNKVVVVDQEQPTMEPFYDLPGGRHDEKNETELQAAQREMLEETGLTFRSWKLIEVRQILSKIEAFNYLFLATDVENEIEQKLDSGEKITVREVDFAEFKELLQSSKFRTKAILLEKVNSLEELLALPDYSEAR